MPKDKPNLMYMKDTADKAPSRLYLRWVRCSFSALYFILGAVVIGSFFIGEIYGIGWLREISLWLLPVGIIYYLIHRNQARLHRFLYHNQDVSHLPARQIRRVNSVFLAIFLCIAGGIMMILRSFSYDAIPSALWAVLKVILRFIFSLFKSDSEPETEAAPTEMPEEEDSIWRYLPRSEKPTRLAEALDRLLIIVSIILILLLICYAIYSLYKKMVSREKKDVLEEHEFLSPFMKKSSVAAETAHKDKSAATDFSVNGKIRRIYKKTIKKRVKDSDVRLNTSTPSELEAYAALEANEKNALLHAYYEKARYSQEGCDKHDYNDFSSK